MTADVNLNVSRINLSKWLLKNRKELDLEIVETPIEGRPALALVQRGMSGGLVIVSTSKTLWVSSLWYFLKNADSDFLQAVDKHNLFRNGLFSMVVPDLTPVGNVRIVQPNKTELVWVTAQKSFA